MVRCRALMIGLVLAGASSTALAQSAKDKKAASDKVKQAIAKSQAGDHGAAITLYTDAYAIIPQPLLLSNIGSEYQQLGKREEALSYFCKYLDADPGGSNASYATTQARTLYVELGGVSDVTDANLCKPIVKPSVFSATAPTGPTTEDKPERVEPRLENPRARTSSLRIAGLGVAGVGVGLLGVGVYFGVQAKNISDDISNHPIDQSWTGVHALEADGQSYETKQVIFLVMGGVAVAAGVTLFFVGKPKQRDYVMAPVATPDSVGFAAAGRF